MNTYYIDGWIEQICWNCGYYKSNSPAYREYPEMFKDIVRKNPSYFMKKFLKIAPSDEFSQQKKSDKDYTEPISVTLISKVSGHMRKKVYS